MSACTELQNNFKWQSVCYFHIKCKEKIKTTLVCKKSQLDAPEATKINYINFNKLWKKNDNYYVLYQKTHVTLIQSCISSLQYTTIKAFSKPHHMGTG